MVRLNPGETKNDEAREIPLIGELREMLSILKAKRAVFDRYNIVSQRDLRDAAAKLESFMEAKSGTKDGTVPASPKTERQAMERETLN